MINKQDVLMGLVCCSESSGYGCNWCPYGGECRETILSGCKHLCADALELLEKQEPKAAISNPEKYGDYLKHCPSCEAVLPNSSQYGRAKFCHLCGQAVKWND